MHLPWQCTGEGEDNKNADTKSEISVKCHLPHTQLIFCFCRSGNAGCILYWSNRVVEGNVMVNFEANSPQFGQKVKVPLVVMQLGVWNLRTISLTGGAVSCTHFSGLTPAIQPIHAECKARRHWLTFLEYFVWPGLELILTRLRAVILSQRRWAGTYLFLTFLYLG